MTGPNGPGDARTRASQGGHVTASGTPGNRGFELAFLMSAGVALLAGICGMLIPVARERRAAGVPLAVAER